MLEYTGSDVVIERVTCSTPLQKDLIVMVLTVGNVYPPQVRNHFRSQKDAPCVSAHQQIMP